MIARLLRKLRLVVETPEDCLAVSAVLQVEVWKEDANESTLAKYLLPSQHQCEATQYESHN